MMLLRDLFTYLWHGPPSLAPSLKVEWRFIVVRWIGIIFVAPGLPLAGLTTERLVAAYVVLSIAGVYNILVHRAMLTRPEIFSSGFITTAADTLLSIGMVQVGGGFVNRHSTNHVDKHILFGKTQSNTAREYGGQ